MESEFIDFLEEQFHRILPPDYPIGSILHNPDRLEDLFHILSVKACLQPASKDVRQAWLNFIETKKISASGSANFRFRRLTAALGRNGEIKCSGISLGPIRRFHGESVCMVATKSKGNNGRCCIEVPVEDLPDLATFIVKAARCRSVSTWKCDNCGCTDTATWMDLATGGTPWCSECDADMLLVGEALEMIPGEEIDESPKHRQPADNF